MTDLHSANAARSARWARFAGAFGLAVLLSAPTALAYQPDATVVKSKPAPAKSAAGRTAKPGKSKTAAAAAATKKHAAKTAAHSRKPEPHKVAAAKKAAARKTVTAATQRAPAAAIAAARPPAPPSYTITTVRGGVVTKTTRVVAPLAAASSQTVAPSARVASKPVQPAAAPPLPAAAKAGAPMPGGPRIAVIEAKSAADFVTGFLQQAFAIVRQADVSALQRRARLGELFAANMNIADIAGYMTADELAAQSPEVQRQFRTILIGYLVETYYPKIEAASDISVTEETTPASPLPDGTAVVWTTFTKRGWGSQSVKWHLAQFGGTFKVKDTISSGASLVEMERATFLSVMRNGGVPNLMARLDARTRELASAATY